MLTFTASEGQIPAAIVRNNYLNNWAFKEKIDCLKAVFCGESIRGNHFSCLLDIVFLLISTRRDAWFFGAFFAARSLACMMNYAAWGEVIKWTIYNHPLIYGGDIHIHFSRRKKKYENGNFGLRRCWRERLFLFFFPVFIFTKLNYHLFRTWSWRRGEGRDAAEGYLPDKLLADASYRPKSDFCSSHFERRSDRFYTWDNRPDRKGPDERFNIQYGVIRHQRWRWWGGG